MKNLNMKTDMCKLNKCLQYKMYICDYYKIKDQIDDELAFFNKPLCNIQNRIYLTLL